MLVLLSLIIIKSGEYDWYSGMFSFLVDILLVMLCDIGVLVVWVGVMWFVMLNGYGGNIVVLEIVVCDLWMEYDMIVVFCFWFGFFEWDSVLDSEVVVVDLYVGDFEILVMLVVWFYLVDMMWV